MAGRRTMGMFFKAGDYRQLRGNPVYGYWNARGFKWTGNRIAWEGVVPKGKSCKGISKPAWDAAFAYVAEEHGLVVESGGTHAHARRLCRRGSRDLGDKTGAGSGDGDAPRQPHRLVSLALHPRQSHPRGRGGGSIELPILLAPKVNQPGWPQDPQDPENEP